MAFDYLSGGSVDLFRLIFEQILKINPSIISKYPLVQDKVIYLILIPHVLLFLFLVAFSKGTVGRVSGDNKGLQYLTSLISYIYIVYSGWYGNLIPLFLGWLWIALALALFLFFVSIIWHPAATPSGAKMLGAVAKEAGKKLSKDKELEKLYEEERHIVEEAQKYVSDRASNPGAAQAYATYQEELFKVRRKIKQLEG
jgi:hypothetical protein